MLIYTLYFVENCTTNLAECWMHIQTKFGSGKQINQSQQGSRASQCTRGGLCLNEGPMWGSQCWEKTVSIPAIKSHAATVLKEVRRENLYCQQNSKVRSLIKHQLKTP